MVYKPCYFYPSEYKKLYQLLNTMKQKRVKQNLSKILVNMFMELIIRCCIQIIFFDADSECFDSAKLLGWKL